MKRKVWKKGLVIMNKDKSGRWKGAGLGMYYCSLCLCERGNLELTSECPECHAQLDIPEDVLLLQNWKIHSNKITI